MRTLRVAFGQINTTVGDLEGNVAKIIEYMDRAREVGADLIAFPELAITGYPPEDLVLRRRFVEDNLKALQEVVRASQRMTAIVGFVDLEEDIYNAAAIIHDGRLVHVYHKRFLPTYGVFDEDRYFQAGTEAPVFQIAGIDVGVNICEDIWYATGPAHEQALGGAEVIININGSPYHAGKRFFRQQMLATRASDTLAIVVYGNLVGGQDELVFDGGSMIFNERGELIAAAPQFEEALLVHDLNIDGVIQARLHDPRRRKEKLEQAAAGGVPKIFVSAAPQIRDKPPIQPSLAKPLERPAEIYKALVTGTRDYVRKNGFRNVYVGLSGGIDSSLTATIAVDALGPECVMGVSMPSRYSSEGSIRDAKLLAENLGIELKIIPIEEVFSAFLHTLEPVFAGLAPDVTEENLQSRIRGMLLMALSNKFGGLVLTTGNKSETATGYSTLYGDTAGGFAVIKDVPKMLVYELAEYRNRIGPREVIPRSVIEKPPSAELRPNQRDEDSLPPYRILDPIMEAYVEDDRTLDEIVAMGYDEATVKRVIDLINRAEYKRRQGPPGVKITPRAFGRDRRFPIANRYRGY